MKTFWLAVACFVSVGHWYYSQERKQKEGVIFKENDIRLEHFNSNFPTIKNVRDSLVSQYQTVGDGLKKLYALYDQVDNPSSKKMITTKIQSLLVEQREIKQQIAVLDAEIERSIVLKSFDHIESGGLKSLVKQEVNKEYNKGVERVVRVNTILESHIK